MRCGLCGFLIIKPQTALHHAMWCGAIMLFCGRFWCDFCGLCGLVNTPSNYHEICAFKSYGICYI